MKHLKLIALCLGAFALVFKFSSFTAKNQFHSGLADQVKNGVAAAGSSSGQGAVRPESEAKVKLSSGTPSELLAGLRKAVLAKNKEAITLFFKSMLHTGGACIETLRVGLIQEEDVEVAKTLADVLVGIGTSEAYQAVMEATMLSENKEAKYAVLDRLKMILNETGNQAFINLALNGKGDLQAAAADFIANAGNPDLLSGLVNSATTREQREVVTKVLGNSLSPSVAGVLQECVNLPDETLAQAAISGLASQSTEQSLNLLLNSFNQPGATPNPIRFQDVVNGVNTMLSQNPDKPGLPIILEALATTSESNSTRAGAIQSLSTSNKIDPAELYQMLIKYQPYETDQMVIPYLQKALARFSTNGKGGPVIGIVPPSGSH